MKSGPDQSTLKQSFGENINDSRSQSDFEVFYRIVFVWQYSFKQLDQPAIEGFSATVFQT